jgi:hypothetical protein
MKPNATLEERKQAFAALNTYVTAQGGWLTSVPRRRRISDAGAPR